MQIAFIKSRKEKFQRIERKKSLPSCKQKLKMPNINENKLNNDLSSLLNDNIKIMKNRKRKYENTLLLNESIKFQTNQLLRLCVYYQQIK